LRRRRKRLKKQRKGKNKKERRKRPGRENRKKLREESSKRIQMTINLRHLKTPLSTGLEKRSRLLMIKILMLIATIQGEEDQKREDHLIVMKIQNKNRNK